MNRLILEDKLNRLSLPLNKLKIHYIKDINQIRVTDIDHVNTEKTILVITDHNQVDACLNALRGIISYPSINKEEIDKWHNELTKN